MNFIKRIGLIVLLCNSGIVAHNSFAGGNFSIPYDAENYCEGKDSCVEVIQEQQDETTTNQEDLQLNSEHPQQTKDSFNAIFKNFDYGVEYAREFDVPICLACIKHANKDKKEKINFAKVTRPEEDMPLCKTFRYTLLLEAGYCSIKGYKYEFHFAIEKQAMKQLFTELEKMQHLQECWKGLHLKVAKELIEKVEDTFAFDDDTISRREYYTKIGIIDSVEKNIASIKDICQAFLDQAQKETQ